MRKVGPTPLITTVIPTYRRPRLLRRAILSAARQSGVGVRIAVFDNCSSDDTGDVVTTLQRQYPGLTYHRHAHNIGAIANFEFAVARVDTPFFSILSDDDYLLPGFYERALAGLSVHPDAMFWVGATLNVDEAGTIWDSRVLRWPRSGIYYPPEGALAMTGGLAPTWTGILFRREVLSQAGFIDPETIGPSDLEFTLRLASRFPYLLERKPVAVFTLNSEGFSSTQPLSAFWPGWIRMFQNVAGWTQMSTTDRNRLLEALQVDARRMLFRRGVNAVAADRLDYARDSATALALHFPGDARRRVLQLMLALCTQVPGAGAVFCWIYRVLERRIVGSRSGIHDAYRHLLIPE